MQTYTFYWKDGTRQVVEGRSPVDALTRAEAIGYYPGVKKRVLDLWEFGDHDKYTWNSKLGEWELKNE